MFITIFRNFNKLQKIAQVPYVQHRVEQLTQMKFLTLEECKKDIHYLYKNSMLEFMSGIKVSTEELEMLRKISNCLKEEELKECKIPVPARHEICKVLNCDIWEVTKFIILFKSYIRMHQYLVQRSRRLESLPKNTLEITDMMKNDPLPLSKESRFMKFKPKKLSRFQKKVRFTKPT